MTNSVEHGIGERQVAERPQLVFLLERMQKRENAHLLRVFPGHVFPTQEALAQRTDAIAQLKGAPDSVVSLLRHTFSRGTECGGDPQHAKKFVRDVVQYLMVSAERSDAERLE